MYRIAICDDDIAYTEYLEKKIKEMLGKSERSSICKYYSGEEFIDDLELEFDLVFLDMQMGEIDGITAAIKFRKFGRTRSKWRDYISNSKYEDTDRGDGGRILL